MRLAAFDMVAIDLDGTLVDTVADLHASVNQMQRSLQRPEHSQRQVRDWVGNGIERLVHRSLTGSMENDAEEALFAEAISMFTSAYQQINGTLSALYPGVIDGLEYLRTLNIPMVVITNKASRFSTPLLKALDIASYFEHHIAGDDLPQKKPHPAPLLHAAKLCAATPARCLLIGDSISDIKAARSAAFTMICVSYGYNHGQNVRELSAMLKPDSIIDSFTELANCLRQFESR